MKPLKISRGGVFLLALLTIGACTHETPEQNPEDEFDDAYYAAHASISSDNAYFTSTDEGGTIYFKTEGGSVTVNVDCGTEWTVENTATDIVSTTLSSSFLTVAAGQNTIEEDLTGTIIFYTVSQHVKFATVTINQAAYGAPEISVKTNEWHAPATGELTAKIAVDATADWTAEAADAWLTVGKVDAGISLTAAENLDTAERSTKVTLTSTDGIKTSYEYINVIQDAKVYLSLSSENVSLSNAGDTGTVTVESNYDWNFSYDSNNGWYNVVRDGNSLIITLTQDNQTYDDIQGLVTITAGDGAENVTEAQIKVVGNGSVNALILVYTTTSANSQITLPLTGTVSCSINWGDGNTETTTSSLPTHTYAAAGEYTVVVSGTVTGLSSVDITTSTKPSDLTAVKQWGKTGLTTMNQAFYYCKNLTSIPEDTLGAFADVTTFSFAFYYCTGLTSIPSGLLTYATNATAFTDAFYYCSNLTSIPEGLFDSATAATDFKYTFYHCSGLKSIPERLFANCVNAQEFTETFDQCSSVTAIGSGLFDGCSNVTDFTNTFSRLSALTSIPEGLFADKTKVTTFYSVFENCTSLTSVPENLFANCSKATSFSRAFYGCTALASLSGNMFSGCTGVTQFNYAFNDCSALTSVPENLFSDCVAVQNFEYTFANSGLTSVPGGLFSNSTSALYFSDIFSGCSALKEIGSGLFANCTSASGFISAFSDCSALNGLSEDMFAGCEHVSNFSYTFSGCSSLTAIPENLFASCKSVTNFSFTFNGCAALTGESAYDVIEVNGEKVNVHLYERENYADSGYTAPSSHASCYAACLGLNDYDTIPRLWGGALQEDLSAVVGTYQAKGYTYSGAGEVAYTTWTLKIYASTNIVYSIFIDGLVPMTSGSYPDSENFIANASYKDGQIVIPAQQTGYINNGYYVGWYPCTEFSEDTGWSRSRDVTNCTFTYDSSTDTWTSDYGEFLAAFTMPSASSGFFGGFYDVFNPGVVLTRISTETSTSSLTSKKVIQHAIDENLVLHTASVICE